MAKKPVPSIPLGMFNMTNVDPSQRHDVRTVCKDCDGVWIYGQPILELTRGYFRISISCPLCGTSTSIVHGNIERIQCVPSSDPENI